jgi:hypothetical protein
MYIYIRMKANKATPANKVVIEAHLPLLPGSVSTARSTCGKPQCACHQDPDKRHGVYYRWTGILGGKRTTKTLSKEEAMECQASIQNCRELQKRINDLIRQSVKTAPWAKRKKS